MEREDLSLMTPPVCNLQSGIKNLTATAYHGKRFLNLITLASIPLRMQSLLRVRIFQNLLTKSSIVKREYGSGIVTYVNRLRCGNSEQ